MGPEAERQLIETLKRQIATLARGGKETPVHIWQPAFLHTIGLGSNVTMACRAGKRPKSRSSPRMGCGDGCQRADPRRFWLPLK